MCGSPCQMAALRAFLRKDYDNLIIADYICRGINSPKVWEKYLESFEERYGYKVIYCKAKSKEYGWRNLTQKVILSNGKSYYETKSQSKFTQGYLQTNAYCRPSCYDCKFKGYPRISDITLGDFWGIENLNKSIEKNLGTSLVMINSKKGEAYFEKVKQRINYFHVPFKYIEIENKCLISSLDPPKVDRKEFFEDLDKMSFIEISKKYIKEPKLGIKRKIKIHLNGIISKLSNVQYSPAVLLKLFKLNSINEIINNRAIIPTPYCCIQIDKGANIIKKGNLLLGVKKFPKSKLETRLLVNKEGTLEVLGNASIGYGADIEVFSGGKLTFKDGSATNINTTIICAEKIEIGKDVKIGRNVTIRDNNGNHFINRAGYKNSRPVIIGDKVWLCEGCTIMSGVKIGEGAIIGAHAFVTQNVPAHALVLGNPAVIVDEDVLWKY